MVGLVVAVILGGAAILWAAGAFLVGWLLSLLFRGAARREAEEPGEALLDEDEVQ